MTEKGPGQLTLRSLLFLAPKCGQGKPTCNTFKRAQVFGSREHQINIYVGLESKQLLRQPLVMMMTQLFPLVKDMKPQQVYWT